MGAAAAAFRRRLGVAMPPAAIGGRLGLAALPVLGGEVLRRQQDCFLSRWLSGGGADLLRLRSGRYAGSSHVRRSELTHSELLLLRSRRLESRRELAGAVRRSLQGRLRRSYRVLRSRRLESRRELAGAVTDCESAGEACRAGCAGAIAFRAIAIALAATRIAVRVGGCRK